MTKHKHTAWALALTAALLGQAAGAATFDWNGSAGSAWGTAANWTLASGTDDDGVPDADDDVTFPQTGSYAGGVTLGGSQACNSLTYALTTGFTLGAAGQALTVASGSLTRQDIAGTEVSAILTCDLVLPATAGTNVWSLNGARANNRATVELKGTLTRSAPLRITGSPANAGSIGFFATNSPGSGAILLAANGSILIGAVPQVVANPIATVGSGDAGLTANEARARLTGGLDVGSAVVVRFGVHNYGQNLVELYGRTTGSGKFDIFRGGVAITNINALPSGNVYVGQAGGAFILDGVSWTAFTNSRSAGYGAGARQWQLGGGGFSARSAPLVIAARGTDPGGAATKLYLNRDFTIGGYRDYALHPVTLRVDTELSARRAWTFNSPSGGVSRTHNANIHRVEGNVTDQVAAGTGVNRGALKVGTGDARDEVVLAGTNNWTGSSVIGDISGGGGTAHYLNTGPGGLGVAFGAGGGFIQFDGSASLPRGNGGSNAWLSAVCRYGGSSGFLLAAKAGGEVYQPRKGYRFIVGTNPEGCIGASGAAGTLATLQNSSVCAHEVFAADAGVMDLAARGPCEMVFGAPGAGTNGAVLIHASYGLDYPSVDTGIGGRATVVSNSAALRTLRSRGDGTVVLRNVRYTLLDGSGDTHTQFKWQLGIADTGAGFFDGAVRETGTELHNSTTGFAVTFRGGVLELGAADLARSIVASPVAGQLYLYGGGGFAAHGAPRRVRLNGGADFKWGDTGNGFPHANNAVLFGSRTANDTLVFENNLDLGGSGTRALGTIRGTGAGPEGRVAGAVKGAAGFNLIATVTRVSEPIPAGTLELAHTNNTFTGAVGVNAGTLRVNGAIRSGSATVTVQSGGALGGTGLVVRPVTVQAGGAFAPGTAAPGTLRIAGSVEFRENAVYRFDYAAGAGDSVRVTGNLKLPTNAVVNVTVTGARFVTAQPLFSATTLSGMASLAGWTLTGVPPDYYVAVDGTEVILGVPPRGTVVVVR